jgi:N-methylhydantoinase A
VTDAAITLGYIDPKFFLGGLMQLNVDNARTAIERELSTPLGLTPQESALAVMALLTETMAGAIEDITINQGIDPRNAVLIGGGGAAGLNSVAIARRIGCRNVVFPDTGAALSAVGGLLSQISDDYAELCLTSSGNFDRETVVAAIERLRAHCNAFAERAGNSAHSTVEFSVEARYAQQIWEIKLPLRIAPDEPRFELQSLCEDFHQLHLAIFAFEDRKAEIEFINWRARVSCEIRKEPIGRLVEMGGHEGFEIEERRTLLAGGDERIVPVYRFEALPHDSTMAGPAIVESQFTTIVIETYAMFRRNTSGSLVVDIT